MRTVPGAAMTFSSRVWPKSMFMPDQAATSRLMCMRTSVRSPSAAWPGSANMPKPKKETSAPMCSIKDPRHILHRATRTLANPVAPALLRAASTLSRNLRPGCCFRSTLWGSQSWLSSWAFGPPNGMKAHRSIVGAGCQPTGNRHGATPNVFSTGCAGLSTVQPAFSHALSSCAPVGFCRERRSRRDRLSLV